MIITLLFGFFIFFILILFLLAYILGHEGADGAVVFATAFFMVILLFVGFTIIDYTEEQSYKEGYKDGQIQAIIGNQHFKREIQPDSTVIWVSIPEQNK